MTKQAMIIIDELTAISPAVKAAIAALTDAIVKEKEGEINSLPILAPKSDLVLQVATPRGWEIANAAVARGDIEINGIPQPPTSYEDVLKRNADFLEHKVKLLRVILNNTETGYTKCLMAEQLDKCETIQEMNEMILE